MADGTEGYEMDDDDGEIEASEQPETDEDEDEVWVSFFDPSRIAGALAASSDGLRVEDSAARSAAAVAAYVLVEIADAANNAAVSDQKRVIQPKHINAAITIDDELNRLGATWLIRSDTQRPAAAAGSAEAETQLSVSRLLRGADRFAGTGISLSSQSLTVLGDIAADVVRRLAQAAARAASDAGRDSITGDDIATALKATLTGELLKSASMEASKA
ncbi:hypothetical protein ACIQ9K_35745 [Streptomyces microflavus]|uniref:hypothetical protein n=1 Tax=Streptomyces microflavus TaxID=1919 RepID=UPI0037FA3939